MTTYGMTPRFLPAGWRRELDLFLAERAAGMNGYMLARNRVASVMRLNAMTDRELAAMGLRRADIPAFVFEELLPEEG
jgi:hypothetical protein